MLIRYNLKREPESDEDVQPPTKKAEQDLIVRKSLEPHESSDANSRLSEDLGKNNWKFKASIDRFDEEDTIHNLVDGNTLPLPLQSVVQKNLEARKQTFGNALLRMNAIMYGGVTCVSSELSSHTIPTSKTSAYREDLGGYACKRCVETGMPCFTMAFNDGLVLQPLSPGDRAQAGDIDRFKFGRWIREDKMLSDEESITSLKA